MKAATAIRTFFNDGPVCDKNIFYPKVSVAEIKEFKDACSDTEYRELARQAAELLGEKLDE